MMRKIFSFCFAILLATPALAQNYQATQGSGTTFGTKLVSAVNYPQIVFCDPTTPSQCVAVDSSGRLTLAGLAQASTTSGQSGSLVMGATTTSAPSYTTAQTNPLSLDLSGGLRVNCATGCSSSTAQQAPLNAGTATATNAGVVGGQYLSAQPTMTNSQQASILFSSRGEMLVAPGTSGFPVTISGNQAVNVAQINSATPLMGNGVTGTGSQRVTIASDNTAFTVNAAQSGTWNITNISGAISLPTGAATAANQTAAAAAKGEGATGAAVPSGAQYMGANVGGNLTGLVATANGLKVDGTAVTQPVSGAASAFVDGWDITQGAKADAACATDNGTCSVAALVKRTNQNLTTLNTTAGGAATLAAAATGGCTPGVILSAASNNSASIKGSAGTLCELSILQTTTTLMDVRLYDSAGAPTCSSATGVVANYVVQSNATSPGMVINLGPFGKAFTSGIGICITGANANNDNTNAATGLNVNYSYK